MYKYLQVNRTVLSVRFLEESKLPYSFIALKLLSNSTKFTAIHILHTSKNNIFIDAIQFHCNVGQSTQYMYIYETMKVQIVFCCVAILCCWNGKATRNGCKFAFSVLLTISFKCLTTITRSTWALFRLDEKAQKQDWKCIPPQIELSYQNETAIAIYIISIFKMWIFYLLVPCGRAKHRIF